MIYLFFLLPIVLTVTFSWTAERTRRRRSLARRRLVRVRARSML